METSDNDTAGRRVMPLLHVLRLKFHSISLGLKRGLDYHEQRTPATPLNPSIRPAPPPQTSGFGAPLCAGAAECDGLPQNAPAQASTSEPEKCA